MSVTLRPILAADDEETDRFILKLAFDNAKLSHSLVTVRDGKEAVDYLSGHAPFTDRAIHPLPALLLLDLKMPRLDGFEVLAWLATRPDFKDLPVVVLSSSSDDSDIKRARQLGARDYFIKPHTLSELVKILHGLQSRWLSAAIDSPHSQRSPSQMRPVSAAPSTFQPNLSNAPN
jgi:CheY-like chemotaxis protein